METSLELEVPEDGHNVRNAAEIFSFRKLATATNNFRSDSLIGEGGFGPVYRGKFEKTGQVSFNSLSLSDFTYRMPFFLKNKHDFMVLGAIHLCF